MARSFSFCHSLKLAAASLLLGASLPVQIWAQQSREPEHFQVRIGSFYEQGDFGTPDTTRVFFLPLTFRYTAQRFDVGVTPSYALIDTVGGVSIIDGIPTRTGSGTRGAVRQTFSGLGDTLVKGRYFLLQDQGPASPLPALTPFVKVKVPTADEKLNLGTGETDYGFGLEVDKQLRSFLLFGDASYTVIGKPVGLVLQNRPAASFGVGKKTSKNVTISGLLDWRRAILRGAEDPLELAGILTYKMSPALSLSPYASVGLSKGSPAFAIGFELAFKFGRF